MASLLDGAVEHVSGDDLRMDMRSVTGNRADPIRHSTDCQRRCPHCPGLVLTIVDYLAGERERERVKRRWDRLYH